VYRSVVLACHATTQPPLPFGNAAMPGLVPAAIAGVAGPSDPTEPSRLRPSRLRSPVLAWDATAKPGPPAGVPSPVGPSYPGPAVHR
jgi:hypothetical protein